MDEKKIKKIMKAIEVQIDDDEDDGPDSIPKDHRGEKAGLFLSIQADIMLQKIGQDRSISVWDAQTAIKTMQAAIGIRLSKQHPEIAQALTDSLIDGDQDVEDVIQDAVDSVAWAWNHWTPPPNMNVPPAFWRD